MKKIQLYNRDGANLWLEREKELEPNIFGWKLKVDKEHEYCLKYMRIIGDFPENIIAIDPAGGPFISIGDEFENRYKVVKIYSPLIIGINERNNNN